jgi:hypothetical protein
LSACYEDVFRRIRCSVADNKIWVSNDETTDVDGRYVSNVVIGTLFAERPGEVILLVSEVLDRANHSTTAVLFNNTTKLLWPDEVRRENILLFLTDAAPYMVKAANGLKMLYPKLVRVALHRVTEEIRGSYSEEDKLISNVKKVFVKAPLRDQQFEQEAPSLTLPPYPVLTRWGTWLDAALYYCENYTSTEDVFKDVDSAESSFVRVGKELFSHSLSGNLAYIKSNFGVISSTITRLEAAGAQLRDFLELVQSVECQIGQAYDKVADSEVQT